MKSGVKTDNPQSAAKAEKHYNTTTVWWYGWELQMPIETGTLKVPANEIATFSHFSRLLPFPVRALRLPGATGHQPVAVRFAGRLWRRLVARHRARWNDSPDDLPRASSSP